MPHLSRADDQPAHPTPWDRVSPAITHAPEGDRRTPPAFERIFAELAMPWDLQLEALEAAEQELALVRRQRDRLQTVRSQLLQARKTEQLAQADLDALVVRRNAEMARAASAVDENPKMSRKRRVEEARTEAARWFDERMEQTRRVTGARLNTAKQEHHRLREEEQQILGNPIVADPVAMQFVDEAHAAVSATVERDRAARDEALRPWAQLRGTNTLLLDELRHLDDDDVLAGQAFGEGPIHLVIGRHLALVELRRGRDGVDVEVRKGVVHLQQIRPDGNVPLGHTDGSTAELRAAAATVTEALGIAPDLVVCVSQWVREPEQLADLHLVGPNNVADEVRSLDEVDLGVEELRKAARALAARALPELDADPVAGLDHFTQLEPEDVPDGLPATRDVIVLAHERRAHELG